MEIKKPKNIGVISKVSLKKRMDHMKTVMKEVKQNLDQYHVYIAQGNRKTGQGMPSVSLIPIYNCGNCKACSGQCYDLRNDLCYEGCRRTRAINAALLEVDRDRYFKEINDAVRGFRFFRWHIGGDIIDTDYFNRMCIIAKDNPHCDMLVFTKMFDVVNNYVKVNGEDAIPKNLKVIFSGWVGQKMTNLFDFPTSHPLFPGGLTSAHDGALLCTGNCTECAKEGVLCFGAEKGTEIVFPAH